MRPEHAFAGIPEPLWRRVSFARHRLLMLDYDGTLAPLREGREQALPMPRSLALLRRIAFETRTTVAVVSGRPVAEVEALVGALPAVLVGEHGWESRAPGGPMLRHPIDIAVATAVDAAERAARASGWEHLLERKRAAVVLHTRRLPGAEALALQTACEAAWRDLARAGGATIDRIAGGVEFRARGHNKGTAVRSLQAGAPAGTLGVFVGDDVTDEDAFEAVGDWGFGVRVGDTARPSLATARLASCDEVPDFLNAWLALAAAEGRR